MTEKSDRRVKTNPILWMLSVLLFALMLFPGKANAALHEYTLTANDAYVSGNITNGKDVDQYKLVLTQAGSLTVTYQGWTIYDSYFQLMDANLETSFFKDEVYYSSDTTPKTKEEARYLEAGVYYIRVFPYSDSRYGTYRLKASFAAAGNNETEPNDSFDKAMALAANTKVTGLISENDTIDFYKFTISSAQKVTITYQGMIRDSYMSLWNKDFESLHNKEVYYGSEDTPKTYTYEMDLTAGTYYIKVVPYSDGNRGRYTLTWKGDKTTVPPSEPSSSDSGSASRGSTVNDSSSSAQYTITATNSGSAAGEVAYIRASAPSRIVRIPDTITVGGTQYKVTSISSKAFAGNNTITKVILGKNVKKINASAFANCKSLKTVKFRDALTTIGSKAFYGCTALKKVDLPQTLKRVGKQAFFGCSKLKKVIIRSGQLKRSKVGNKAFAKIAPGATAYVPASKIKTYRKVLKGLAGSSQIAPVM